MPTDSVLMIAAEASSCMYAKNLIQKWREISPNTQFFGVGDRQMQAEGMDCQGLAEDLAVVGLQEVLSHWPEIKACFQNVLKEAETRRPRFAILIDYPGFNLRLARKLKNLGIPVVYYISPQLWAWKKGRVEQVRRYVDDMMVVFPFEVDFYKRHNIKAHFVGHPLLEVIEQEHRQEELTKGDHWSSPDQLVLGLMPGSRRSEIRFNLEVQLQVAKRLQESHGLRVRLLVAPTLDVAWLQSLSANSGVELELVQSKPTQMIQACDLILSASGTATLQVALLGKPMVVMYRMNALTAFFAKLLVRDVKHFCIVNLVADQKIVPELFQSEANVSNLHQKLAELIDQPAMREKMLADLSLLRQRLGQGGATQNLVDYLKTKYGWA